MITINLDKAKNITKERLRIERKPLLEAQDILFMQAQESGSDTTAIVAEKQRLRNITNEAVKKVSINFNYSFLVIAKPTMLNNDYLNIKETLFKDFERIK